MILACRSLDDLQEFRRCGRQVAGGQANGGYPTDQRLYVIDGELTVFVGDERIEARPGDFVLGPKGVPHTFLVTSERADLERESGPDDVLLR